MRRQLPNILTTIRILCSISLLACQPLSAAFILIYISAGITDILDGITARYFHAVTPFGEKYDSLADIIFIAVCLFKLLPIFHLQVWGIAWICLIAVIKGTNLLMSYICHRKKLFLHTIANKITGGMLFLTPLLLVWMNMNYILPVVCTVATFSAVQEGYYIKNRKNGDYK